MLDLKDIFILLQNTKLVEITKPKLCCCFPLCVFHVWWWCLHVPILYFDVLVVYVHVCLVYWCYWCYDVHSLISCCIYLVIYILWRIVSLTSVCKGVEWWYFVFPIDSLGKVSDPMVLALLSSLRLTHVFLFIYTWLHLWT